MEQGQSLKEQTKPSKHGLGTWINDRLWKYTNTRTIVMTAVIAALYAVMTVTLAPIGYGVLQFRTACVLYGLVIFDPVFALGMAMGVFFADLASPFGAFDWGLMPFVALIGCLLAYTMRRWPVIGLILLATIISIGVAVFPLGLGAHLPFIPTFVGIWITQLVIVPGGWLIIWRPLRTVFESGLHD